MDYLEFEGWLAQYKDNYRGSYSGGWLPPMVDREYWAKVYNDIYPHFYGFMPKAIRDAFPNEAKKQLKYRLRIHKSMTKAELWQAIFDVKRVMMGDKFTIETGDLLGEWLSSRKFGTSKMRMSFEGYLWDMVYPHRVLDPNAVLAVIPTPTSENERVKIELRIFPSDCIEYYDDDKVVIYDKKISSSTAQKWWVFTRDMVMIRVKRSSKNVNEQSTDEIQVIYEHFNGFTGVCPLGGVHMVIQDYRTQREVCYYESDFSYAVPLMEKVEIKDNQKESSTLNCVFPLRVTQGLDCQACDGEGKIRRSQANGQIYDPHDYQYSNFNDDMDDALDSEIFDTCKKCHGKGTIPLGALDGVVATPVDNDPMSGDGKDIADIGKRFVAYVSPETSSIVELREQGNQDYTRMVEALGLTKPSKMAESGISKEKDREAKYTKLQNIADGMRHLIECTLKTVIHYLFVNEGERQPELEQLAVIPPQDFQIKSVTEIQEEYFKDIDKKPMSIRYKQHKELLSKRFKENDVIHALDDLAIEYTDGLFLQTLEELQTLNNLGVINAMDIKKARIAFPIIKAMHKAGELDLMADRSKLLEVIDAKIQPMLQPPTFTNPIPDFDA